MKVTIEHYIATNNPNAAQAVLAKYGVPAASSMTDLIKKIHYIVAKHKEIAILDLSTIETPYKKLITATQKTIAPIVEEAKKVVNENAMSQPLNTPAPSVPTPSAEMKSNACGCSGFDGEEKSGCYGCGGTCGKSDSSNATGSTKTTTPAETKSVPTTETKIETPVAPKMDYMPLVVLGVVGLIAVVVIAKK